MSALTDCRKIVTAAGTVSAALGGVVLIGGALGLFIHADGVFPTMMTSLLFLLTGIALMAQARASDAAQVVRSVVAVLILLISGARLVVALATAGEPLSGPSQVPASVGFLLVGLSLLFVGVWRPWAAHAGALAVAALVLIGASGYAVGLPPDESVLAGLARISLIGLSGVACGLLSMSPQYPPFSWVVRRTNGARLARRLVPTIFAIPLTAELVGAHWEGLTGLSGLSGAAIGVAFFIALLGAITAVGVRAMEHADERLTSTIEDLAASERRYRELADGLPVGLFSLDTEHNFTFLNPYFCDLIGLPSGDPKDARAAFGNSLHPEDRARALAASAAARAAGEPLEIEYRLIRPDGATRHVVLVSRPRRGPDGQVESYHGTITDVTERRAAEQAVVESEDRFRNLALDLPSGVIHRDRDHCITYINNEARAIFGLGLDDDPAIDFSEIVHPDDRDAMIEASYLNTRFGRDYELELRIVQPSGDVRWVIFRGSRQVDGNGAVVSYSGTVVDVTDRRCAEDAVRVQERRAGLVADAVSAGVGRIGLDGDWTYTNDRMLALWHLPAGHQMTGDDLFGVLHEDDRDLLAERWEAAIVAGAGMESEFRVVAPDGSTRWTWSRAEPVHDDDGELAGFQVMALDIEDRRSVQEALAQSEEMHRLMLSNLSGIVIVVFDRDLRCVRLEGEHARNAGLTTARCAGQRLGEFVPAQLAGELEPLLRAALRGRFEEREATGPTGLWSRFQASPFRDADGMIDGVMIVCTDITAQLVAEQAARHANETVRQLSTPASEVTPA